MNDRNSINLKLAKLVLSSDNLWVYCGTFLISFAILAFEITTVRTINFVIDSRFVYFAIAIAMLGLSVAGSVLSCLSCDSWKIPRELVLFAACLATAGSFIACHFLAADLKQEFNQSLSIAGHAGGLEQILTVLGHKHFTIAFTLGAALSLPYFLFGILIGYLFVNSRREGYASLYAVDLVGAALGSVSAIVIMEASQYAMSVTLPAVIAVLAAVAYITPLNRYLAIFGVAVAILLAAAPWSAWYASHIEPESDPHYLTRDYSYDLNLEETWHAWNSFTRVGAVETTDEERDYAILSLANGDGMAWLLPYVSDRTPPRRHGAVVPALLLDPPDDVLVLFAGAGADLMSLHEHGADRVTGLEINQLMIDGGRALKKYKLAEFLQKGSVNLEVSEARVFLERDKQRYDLIVYSWSGASAAYYSGAIGGTTEYLFTYEGYSAVFEHLKSDGYTLIHGTNKVRALAAIRRYLTAHGIDNATRTSIVLFTPNSPNSRWDSFWDGNELLFKPSGWSDQEISQIVVNARKEGLVVAYAPGMVAHPDFLVYDRILSTNDVEAELADIRSQTSLRFEIVTDNRPYHFDLIHNNLYLKSEFWLGVLGIGDPGTLLQSSGFDSAQWFQLLRVKFVANISMAAIFFTFLPLVLRRDARRAVQAKSFHLYFFCLGTGFMLLEIALMQKASLLFGHPGVAIAVVLGSMIFFTGIGSLVSNRTFGLGLSIRSASLFVTGYVIVLMFTLDFMLGACLAWPTLAKSIFIFAIAAPAAFFMGHLFPQGIALAAKEHKALVPWAWGVNGATSAVAAGIAPLLAQAAGFRTIFIIVAAVYGFITMILARRLHPSENS